MKNAVVLLNVVFLHSQTTRASTQRTPTTNIMRIRHSQFGIRTMQHLTVFFTSSAQVWGKEWTSLFLPESKIRNMTWFCMTFCKSGSEMSTVSTCLLVGWDGWETSHRLTTSKGSCTMLVTAETSSTSTNVLIEKKTASIFLSKHTAIFRHIVASSAASSPVFQVVTDLEVSRCQRTRFPVTARVPKLNAIAETILMGMRWR